MAVLLQLLFLWLALFNVATGLDEIPDTTTPGTSEYYYVTTSTTLQKTFTCAEPLCHIECSGASSCKEATIDASGSTTLELQCVNQYACQLITILGPSDTADVQCISEFGYSCQGTSTLKPSTFSFTNTKNINIVCDQETKTSSYSGSCRYLALWATNAESVTVECANKEDCQYATFNVDSATSVSIISSGTDSLTSATINAGSAGSLSVACNAGEACYSTVIYPPAEGSEYAFSIFCLSSASSCHYVEVKLTSSTTFTPNFMEMICPQTDSSHFTGVCDFEFFCADLGTSEMSGIVWSSDDFRYECNDQDCCPWTDYDNMVQESTIIHSALPGAITPTSTNDTAEFYELSVSVDYRMISCGKQACFIECTVVDACDGMTVYAGASDYLSITCSGTSSCSKMYITQGPSNQVDISCSAKLGSACRDAVFGLTTTSAINILCGEDTATSSYTGNCYAAVLWAEEAATVDVFCEGDEACSTMDFHLDSVSESAVITGNIESLQQIDVYAASANYLEINCNAYSTCYSMNVYPPYTSEYAFKLHCAPHTQSCNYVDIIVPLSTGFTDNFMELVCARTSSRATICDVSFTCLDRSSSSVTEMVFESDAGDRYVCNDADCCPWPNLGMDGDYTLKAGTVATILPNSMDPTSEDETGQYYVITADSTDLNEISCTNTAGCFISCTDTSACDEFVVYAADTDYLQLICSGFRSCDELLITVGPKVQADINCTAIAGYACYSASFIMEDTDTINLFCYGESTSSYSGGCYGLDLWATDATTVNIHCLEYQQCRSSYFNIDYVTSATIIGYAEDALYYAYIYARHAGKLNMECNVEDACDYTTVYPPYDDEYIFRLTCGVESACYYFTVQVPNTTVTVNNYMSLRCPDYISTSSYYYSSSGYCDIGFTCYKTSSSIVTDITYSTTNQQWECSDDDCCPWSDPGYMVAPLECVWDRDTGEFCGYSLFVKGFNIWTLELSGNAILDLDKLVQNTESWTDEGGSCSLSTLEFSSSYSTYMSYAEEDSTNIAGSYSTGDSAAGGSLSTARTETKKYAAQEQSYIYSMDISCITAEASIVATNEVYWNENFINNLRILPSSYDENDLDDYLEFWSSYGTHIMKTAKYGGLVRGAVVSQKCGIVQEYGDSSSYELCLNGAYKGVEVAGCGGESSSSYSNNTAQLLVSKTQIDVRGGDTATFTTLFNQFKSKSTDFQGWIDDLAILPDVVGGNLDEIHDVILNALSLGNHRLNEGLSSANQLTDTEWQDIANALNDAYTARTLELATEDTSFDATVMECEISSSSCEGGTVDESTCVCTGCGSNDCCALSEDEANIRSASLCIILSIFSLLFK